MPDILLSTENFFHLRATIGASGELYAFHLLFNGEVIERTPYGRNNTHRFVMRKPGGYRVRFFVRSGTAESQSWVSESMRYDGFLDVPPARPRGDLSVLGVSMSSAFAAHVFSVRNEVTCFVDPTGEHNGIEFFGKPVVDTVPAGTILIGHENSRQDHLSFESFSLSQGSTDILSKELHKFSAMELYRISRAAYLDGLQTGAYHIQAFIFNKYNSRVPFMARIGEGTKLGIGGIGTVIHPDSIIGKDCVIAQNVTLGSRGRGTPVVGNNVFIGPGAKCLGNKIGNNVVIGANSVVLDDIPDDCVVAGVPARVISRDIKKYANYISNTVTPK